jgi:hypothetical protein
LTQYSVILSDIQDLIYLNNVSTACICLFLGLIAAFSPSEPRLEIGMAYLKPGLLLWRSCVAKITGDKGDI